MADITAEEHGILWKRDEKQKDIFRLKNGLCFLKTMCERAFFYKSVSNSICEWLSGKELETNM